MPDLPPCIPTDRDEAAERVASAIAGRLDGEYLDVIESHVIADHDGNAITLTAQPEPGERARTFVITVREAKEDTDRG